MLSLWNFSMLRFSHVPGVLAALILFGSAAGASAQSAQDLFNILDRALRQSPEAAQQPPPPRQSRPQTDHHASPPSQARDPGPSYTQSEVREAQRLLNGLGYDAGPVDGAFGKRTRSAIISFQQDEGLPVDGAISAALLTSLRTAESKSHPAEAGAEADLALIYMEEATKICVGNTGRPDLVEGALSSAGFSLVPGVDAGTFEARAPGVYALIDTSSSRTHCSIQSQEVALSTAREIGMSVTRRLFPSAKMFGHGACDGPIVTGLRPPLRMTFAQAGNSRECIDDGTSAIVIQAAQPGRHAAPAQTPDRGPSYARSEVREAQRLLNGLGYDAGPVDGAFGRRTREAIVAFQQDESMPVDGAISAALLRSLHAAQSGRQEEFSGPHAHDAAQGQTMADSGDV